MFYVRHADNVLRHDYNTLAEVANAIRHKPVYTDGDQTGRFLIGATGRDGRLAWSAMAYLEKGRVVRIEQSTQEVPETSAPVGPNPLNRWFSALGFGVAAFVYGACFRYMRGTPVPGLTGDGSVKDVLFLLMEGFFVGTLLVALASALPLILFDRESNKEHILDRMVLTLYLFGAAFLVFALGYTKWLQLQ